VDEPVEGLFEQARERGWTLEGKGEGNARLTSPDERLSVWLDAYGFWRDPSRYTARVRRIIREAGYEL
jgi:hypothetical protein